MAKFITTSAFSVARIQTDYSAQFKNLFTSLTGYDLMVEESRKDLTSLNPSDKSDHVLSYLLPDYISKFTVLFERKSCNNEK